MPGDGEGISTRVSVLGDKEYKTAMADIGRTLRVMNSDLQASQSEYKGQEDSMAALADKSKILQKIYDEQAKKVQLVAEQLEKAKAENDGTGQAVDNLTIALNKAKVALNNTGAELSDTNGKLDAAGKAETGLGDDSKQLADDLSGAEKAVEQEGEAADTSEEKNSRMRDSLHGLGEAAGAGLKTTILGIATAFAAVGAAALEGAKQVFSFAQGAGEMADNVLTLSTQTGISAQSLQKWTYASQFVDTSVETMTGSMTKMIRGMGSGNKAFEELGVSIKDGSGKLRDSETVFWDSIEALGKISNETERDALAMEIFGKSAQELNPLIEAGRDRMEELGYEAVRMGAVFSGDALNAMGSFDDSMQRFKLTADGMKNAIGLTVMPMFQPLVDTATQSMADISNALSDGLQPGELDGLVSTLLDTLEGSLADISGMLTQAMPYVTKAIKVLVVNLARQLPTFVSTLLPGAVGLLQGVLDSLRDNADALGALASDLVIQLVDFLIDAAPELAEAAGDMITGLVDGLLDGDSLAKLVSGAVEMVGKLAAALVKNAIVLAAKAPEIIGQLITGLINTDWLSVGAALIDGISTAIASAFTNVDEIASQYKQDFAESIAAYEAFNTALDRADGQLNQSSADAEGKKELATQLLALYDELGRKDIKTDADLTLMADYAKQIAEIYPELGKYIDPVTGSFTLNTQAIRDNIDAQFQLELIGAYQDYRDSLIQALAQGNIALAKHQKEQQAIQAEWDALKTQSDSLNGLYGRVFEGGGLAEFQENLTDVYNAIRDNTGIANPLAGYVDVLENGNVVLRDGVDAAAAYDAAQTQLVAAVGSVSDAFSIQNGKLQTANQQGAEYQQTVTDVNGQIVEMNTMIQQSTDQYGKLKTATQEAGDAASGAGTSIDQSGDAAQDGATKIAGAVETIDGATDSADESAQSVKTAGDEISAAAQGILTTAEDIKGAQTAAEGAQTAIADIVTDISDEAAAALTTVTETTAAITLQAQAMMEAMQGVVDDSLTALAKAGATVAQALLDAIVGVLTEKAGKAAATTLVTGLRSGLTDGKPGVKTDAQALADAAKTALSTAVGPSGSNFNSIGAAIASGVARGITNNTSVVTEAAKKAAQAAYKAMCDELGIKSPSTVAAQAGRYFTQGFSVGVDDGTEQMLTGVRTVSAMAAGELRQGGESLRTQTGAAAGPGIDYAQLGQAVADAMEARGLGEMTLDVDGRELGKTRVADGVSQTLRQKSDASARGRGAKLVIRP